MSAPQLPATGTVFTLPLLVLGFVLVAGGAAINAVRNTLRKHNA